MALHSAEDKQSISIDVEHQLLNEASDAVILLNVNGTVAYWSKGAELMFGYGNAETVGKSFMALLVPNHRLTEERRSMEQISVAGSLRYGAVRIKKDGSLVFTDIAGKALYKRDGAVEHILLREKEGTRGGTIQHATLTAEQLGIMLNSMPEAMVVVNDIRDGRYIVLANRRAEILFGYLSEELRGQRIDVLLPSWHEGSDPESESSRTAHAFPISTISGARSETFGQRKDGGKFPMEISWNQMQIGHEMLICGAIRDISEHKNIERTLSEKIAVLEAAISAKDRFLAGVSHELRTPLNAIIGFTGTLLMQLPGPLTSDQDKQLRTIQSSARHLLALTNDFLDLALIEAGQLKLHPESFACQEIIQELSDTFLPSAHRKGLRFSVQSPGEDIVVFADRRVVRQILINLVSNAIKYTERGEVLVSLSCRRAEGRSLVDISVQDTGIGIAQEDQKNLFQAYARFDSSLTRPAEGTGLGLYLSRKLAHLIDAELSCTSRYGEGACFTLVLNAIPARHT